MIILKKGTNCLIKSVSWYFGQALRTTLFHILHKKMMTILLKVNLSLWWARTASNDREGAKIPREENLC